MKQLTERQSQILQFIVGFVNVHGYPPTLREIGSVFGISSTNGVTCHLNLIEKKGYIQQSPMKSRGIRVMKNCNVESMNLLTFKELAPTLFRAQIKTDILCKIKEAFDNA